MSGAGGVDAGLRLEVARLIVDALNLEVAPEAIDPAAPLYGDGLGLDSIDILEVALVAGRQYGVELRADSQENAEIFRSLDHFVAYVAAHRSR